MRTGSRRLPDRLEGPRGGTQNLVSQRLWNLPSRRFLERGSKKVRWYTSALSVYSFLSRTLTASSDTTSLSVATISLSWNKTNLAKVMPLLSFRYDALSILVSAILSSVTVCNDQCPPLLRLVELLIKKYGVETQISCMSSQLLAIVLRVSIASFTCFLGLSWEAKMCLTIPLLSMMYVTLPGISPREDSTP